MLKSVWQVCNDLAVYIGDPLLPECEPEEGPLPSLEDRVRLMLPMILTRLLAEHRSEIRSGWKSLKGLAVETDLLGTGTVKLPEDFLLFGHIHLRGWKNPLTCLLDSDDPVTATLTSIWSGIRGSRERPRGIMTIGEEGEMVLKLYGCEENTEITEGSYYPRPSFDSQDRIEIPDELYGEVLERLKY